MNRKNLNNTMEMLVCAVMLLALVLAAIPAAHANVVVWDGGAGTSDWNTAENWDPEEVPNAESGASATIALSGANVTIYPSPEVSDRANVRTLIVSGDGATAPTLNIEQILNVRFASFRVGSDGSGEGYGGVVNHTTDTLTIHNGGSLRIAGAAGSATLDNSGTYNFGGAELPAPTADITGQVVIGQRHGETGLLSMSGYGTFSTSGRMGLGGWNGTGELRVEGGNLTINLGERLQMTGSGGSSTIRAIIDDTGFSTINIAEDVALGGRSRFVLELGEGYQHVPGTEYLILDAVGDFINDGEFNLINGASYTPGDLFTVNDYEFYADYRSGSSQFVVTAIPEPSSLALIALAGLVLMRRRRR